MWKFWEYDSKVTRQTLKQRTVRSFAYFLFCLYADEIVSNGLSYVWDSIICLIIFGYVCRDVLVIYEKRSSKYWYTTESESWQIRLVTVGFHGFTMIKTKYRIMILFCIKNAKKKYFLTLWAWLFLSRMLYDNRVLFSFFI